MYPCIPSWRIIYVGGATRPPTGSIGILSFLPSRLKVAFLSPLPYLSLTISVRLLKQPGYKSMMVRGSGFITFVTR